MRSPDETPRRRWRRWLAALVLLLGIGGLVWAVRPDPHLGRAKELQKELFSPEAKNLPADQRKALFAQYRTEVKHLTDDQKWELGAPMRAKQKAELDHYFTLSPAAKLKYLDERIDKSEKMRKDWAAKGAKGGGPGGGPPGAGGFAGTPGAGPKGGGGPGRGPGRAPPSADDIEKRKKQHLEHTTPEERAKTDLFRKDMDARRKQRGLPVRTG